MADAPLPPPLASLARAREVKISELSQHFANDDLSLEELERRIERVYKSVNVADLEAITADLQGAVAPPADLSRAGAARGKSGPPALEAVSARLLSLMSTTKRVGRWTVPRTLDIMAIMSDTRMDLTQAVMPAGGGVATLELRAVMASLKLIVPPGMRVIVDTHSVMSSVRSRAEELPLGHADPNAPVVRLTGFAFMSDVSVVVRRREDPVYDDDEDED